MSTRENLYEQFGPMLIEAMALVIKDEINILRAQHGLPDRSDKNIVDAVETKLSGLSKYDWMTKP